VIGVISWSNRKAPVGYVVGDPPGSAGATLDELTLSFRKRGVSLVALGGSDGARHRALTALATAFAGAQLPELAILPDRGGLLADNLGLGGDPRTLLATVIEGHHAGARLEVAEVDTIAVEGRIGFTFGAGMAVGFVEELGRRRARSSGAIAWELGKLLVSAAAGGEAARRLYERRRTRVEADGEAWPTDRFSVLLAGTLPALPLGLRPLHRAGELPRTFHLVGLATTPAALPAEVGRLALGRQLSAQRTIDSVAREAVLTSDRPFRYVLDGVAYEAGEVLRLAVGPRLRIVRPG
jgi:diacylglycerol kinase (ATP)